MVEEAAYVRIAGAVEEHGSTPKASVNGDYAQTGDWRGVVALEKEALKLARELQGGGLAGGRVRCAKCSQDDRVRAAGCHESERVVYGYLLP